jgi:hypothetical protein
MAATIPTSPANAPKRIGVAAAAIFELVDELCEPVVVVVAVVRLGVPELKVTVPLPPPVTLSVLVLVVVDSSLLVVELDVEVMVIVPDELVLVVVVAVASPLLKTAHSCEPTLCAVSRSDSAQDLMRQGAALLPIAACVGPHWQA